MTSPRPGKITTEFGAFPESHELATAKVFIKAGLNVHFLAPSRTEKEKTPDVKIAGVLWEMKSPIGTGKRTIPRIIKKALRQSNSIILDARRSSFSDAEFLKILQTKELLHGVRRLKLVTKQGEILDIKK